MQTKFFNCLIYLLQKTATINGAKVEIADIEASNGVIHVMGRTIVPIPSANIAQILATDPR